MNFHILIPARYQSTRLPGKVLMELQGMSILERVYRQACRAGAQSIRIATDNVEIATHAKAFGAQVVMTAAHHPSGTDRIAEAVRSSGFAAEDIIVNVQGDEPFLAPELIRQVAQLAYNTTAPMATLCWPIHTMETLHNPNVVKVVRSRDGYALYFSRSPIPAHRDNPEAVTNSFKHIGLYAYKAAFLQEFVGLAPCALEQEEALEQLRALWAGFAIKIDVAVCEPAQDINTREDFLLAQELLMRRPQSSIVNAP